MKHLLIPTDFSIQSLNIVHAAIAAHDNGEEKLKITLFHLLSMSTDLSELVFRSMTNKHYEMVGEEFKEACEILQNRYSSKVKSINVKFGFGNTVQYLKNFLEGAKVDMVIIPSDAELTLPSTRSVEMVPLLKRTGVAIDVVSTKKSAKHIDMSIINMMPANEMKVPKTDKKYASQN